MKITLASIVESAESIKNLQTVKMPVKVSYRIKRLADRLSPILTSFNEKRDELIKELGEKTEGGGYQVKADNIPVFLEKIKELTSVEEEVEWEKISVDELGDVQLSPRELVDFIFV